MTLSTAPSSSRFFEVTPSDTPPSTPSKQSSSAVVSESRTPTLSYSPSTVRVNSPCQGNYYICPSGECKSSSLECTGEPTTGSAITETTVTITEAYENKEILIYVSSDDGKSVGSVSFPPNLLKVGWNVTISSTEATPQDVNDCGDSSVFASNPFEIEVRNSRGKLVKKFDRPLNLSLFGRVHDWEDVCVGYSEDKGRQWQCNPNDISSESTGTNGVYVVQTTSDHLTSFAVLLGSPTGSGCDWGWVETVSLALIATAICITIAVVIAFWFSTSLRKMISGRANLVDEMNKIRKLQEDNSALLSPLQRANTRTLSL